MARTRRQAKKDREVVENPVTDSPEAPKDASSANDEQVNQVPAPEKAQQPKQDKKNNSGFAFGSFFFFSVLALALVSNPAMAPLFYLSIFSAVASMFYLSIITDKNSAAQLKVQLEKVDLNNDELAKTLIKEDKTFSAKYDQIKAFYKKVDTLKELEAQCPLMLPTGELHPTLVHRYVGSQLKAVVDAKGKDKVDAKNQLASDLADLDVYTDAKIKTTKAKIVIQKMRRS